MYRSFNEYLTCTGCENYTCPANTWKCKYSHKCIDEEDVGNEYEGEILFSGDCCPLDDLWCEDKSDEDKEMCRNYTCLSGFWKTRSHKCIREHFVCDGNINSEDESDEENCETHTCAKGYVKCGDLKTCVEVRRNIEIELTICLNSLTLVYQIN